MKYNRYENLDHLIAIAASRCLQKEEERWARLDTSHVKFDAAYQRKRARMIRKVNGKPTVQKLRLVAVRVAVAVLGILLLAALAIGCVPAVRELVFKAVIEWHDNYFEVSFQPDHGETPEPDAPSDGADGSDTVDPTGSESVPDEPTTPPEEIQVKRKPTALPQGVYEDVLKDTSASYTVDYYLNDEYILTYSQRLIDTQGMYDDTDAVITDILVNGHYGILIEYKDHSEIFIEWVDGEYRYQMMSAFYEKEELIIMAESVK